MIEGSCYCKAVEFELLNEPSMMGTCHCSRCRKAGASTIVFVKKNDLRWVKGKENVTLYKAEDPFKYGRCFCKICGTSLGEILSEEESFPIAANAIDTELSVIHSFHESLNDKPKWLKISEDEKSST